MNKTDPESTLNNSDEISLKELVLKMREWWHFLLSKWVVILIAGIIGGAIGLTSLIAGPNPPGNLKAMINGIKKGYYFNIAGGKAKKSIVLAEDIAKIIPIAANIGGIYNLTDQYHPSFSELSHIIAEQMGKSQPFNIPVGLAHYMAKVGDLIGSKAMNSGILKKMTSDLTFDDSKAQLLLGWKPTPVLNGLKII